MENEKFVNLGKNCYDWYKARRLEFFMGDPKTSLNGEIERVAELIEYVIERRDSLVMKKS